jgi:hypothetical protein
MAMNSVIRNAILCSVCLSIQLPKAWIDSNITLLRKPGSLGSFQHRLPDFFSDERHDRMKQQQDLL